MKGTKQIRKSYCYKLENPKEVNFPEKYIIFDWNGSKKKTDKRML